MGKGANDLREPALPGDRVTSLRGCTSLPLLMA